MNKKVSGASASDPRAEQRMTAWSAAMSRAIGELAGGRPVAQKVSPAGQESRGDVIWWQCVDEPEIAFGIGSEDQTALMGLREAGPNSSAEENIQDIFREMMDLAWGSPGAISTRQSGDEVQAWRFQLENGQSLEILAARTAPPATSSPLQETSNLDMLLDIELPLTLRFGSAQMAMREVAGLVTGSVIELDRGIDEPIEIMINGHVIARGEAVTVGGAYGVRISEVSSRRESWVTSSMMAPGPASGVMGEKNI